METIEALQAQLERVTDDCVSVFSDFTGIEASAFTVRTAALHDRCVVAIMFTPENLQTIVESLTPELQELLTDLFVDKNKAGSFTPEQKAQVIRYNEQSRMEEPSNQALLHNLIKVTILPTKTENGLSLRGAVLDGFLFYTATKIKTYLKAQQPKYANQMMKALEAFLFDLAKVDVIALNDGWEGFSKAAKKTITSEDVQQKLLSTTASPQTMEHKARWGAVTASQSKETRLQHAQRNGYYGAYGYILMANLEQIDPTLLHHPALQETRAIATYNDEEFNNQLCYKFRPVKLTVVNADSSNLVPLHGTPAKYNVPKGARLSATAPPLTNETVDFLSLFDKDKKPFLSDVLATGNLVLFKEKPPQFALAATGPQAAFVDMC